MRARAFFKCPKGELFDNDILPPRCINETVVKGGLIIFASHKTYRSGNVKCKILKIATYKPPTKSCGKYVGPNTQLARQYIAYHTFSGPDDVMARPRPSFKPMFFEDYFEDGGEHRELQPKLMTFYIDSQRH